MAVATIAHIQSLGVPAACRGESPIFRDLVVAGGALLYIFGAFLPKVRYRAFGMVPLIKQSQNGGGLARIDQDLGD